MPQPLSKVKPGAALKLGPQALEYRPALAAQVMRVVGEWAHIDATFSAILTTFLKADFIVVNAMMEALTGGTARSAAFLKAASQALPKSDFELVQAVLKVTKGSRNRRNEFAHHIWAYSDEVSDALLLINPSQIMAELVEWQDKQPDHSMPYRLEPAGEKAIQFIPRPPPVRDYSQVRVFREGDLKRDCAAALRAHAFVTRLWAAFQNTPESEQARNELLAQPEIAKALLPQSTQTDH